MTAKRRPSITFVANKAGTFIRASGARCWTKQSVDYNFVGSPPFGFFPKEYMSVGARHGNRVELIGKMSAFRGFKETDTLNATTHQMIGESIFFGRDQGSASLAGQPQRSRRDERHDPEPSETPNSPRRRRA